MAALQDRIDKAANTAARSFTEHNHYIRTVVASMFAHAGIPLPDKIDADNWSKVCAAVCNKTALASTLPTSLTQFQRHEDIKPVGLPRARRGAQEGSSVEEAFAHAYESLRHLARGIAASPPECEHRLVPVPPLEWYSARQRRVAAFLAWLDTEAAPVVDALAAAAVGDREHAFALLGIPRLQSQLREVEQAYAAAVARAQKNEETRTTGHATRA